MKIVFEQSYLFEITFKLFVAAALSLIIGIERELKKKPVGLKTCLVIATFSCLLTIISIETAYSTPPRNEINITMDPLRLAAQIVSGIGFLGAGVILRKENNSISGLTTAAMIWGAAGIGIAVGANFYLEAFISVIIVVIGIKLIAPFLLKIGPKKIRLKDYSLKILIDEKRQIDNFITFLNNNDLYVENIKIKDLFISENNIKYELDIRISTLYSETLSLYYLLHSFHYMKILEIESLS